MIVFAQAASADSSLDFKGVIVGAVIAGTVALLVAALNAFAASRAEAQRRIHADAVRAEERRQDRIESTYLDVVRATRGTVDDEALALMQARMDAFASLKVRGRWSDWRKAVRAHGDAALLAGEARTPDDSDPGLDREVAERYADMSQARTDLIEAVRDELGTRAVDQAQLVAEEQEIMRRRYGGRGRARNAN